MSYPFIDYFDPKNSPYPYKPDCRLGVCLSVLLGKKRVSDLTNLECSALGYDTEECKLLGQAITADVVRQYQTQSQIRDKAENMIGTLFFSLMWMCAETGKRCESLEKRVAELEGVECAAVSNQGS